MNAPSHPNTGSVQGAEALLPCPFCGGVDACFVHGADDDGQWVAVVCPDCGAGTRQHYPIMDDARPHAQGAWNTRTPLTPKAGEPDGDGWIAWAGGECPLNPHADTRVLLRSGEEANDRAATFDWEWSDDEPGTDIIAYRIVSGEVA